MEPLLDSFTLLCLKRSWNRDLEKAQAKIDKLEKYFISFQKSWKSNKSEEDKEESKEKDKFIKSKGVRCSSHNSKTKELFNLKGIFHSNNNVWK